MTDSTYNVNLEDLEEVEKPSSSAGRKAKPNPLLDAVKSRIGQNIPVRFTVPYGSADAGEARRKSILNDLTRAGRELDVTVRRQVVLVPTKPGSSEGNIQCTFWVQDKIVHGNTQSNESVTKTAEA